MAPLVRDRHENFKTDFEQIACNWVKKVKLDQVRNMWYVAGEHYSALSGILRERKFLCILKQCYMLYDTIHLVGTTVLHAVQVLRKA
jgi:hypothetical protein